MRSNEKDTGESKRQVANHERKVALVGLEVDVVYPPQEAIAHDNSASPSNLVGEQLECSPRERPTISERDRISSVMSTWVIVIELTG